MKTGPTQYFILVYDLTQRHVDVHEFGGDRAAATMAYSSMEDQYAAAGHYEVVLVGADSIETIRRTHSPYFSTGSAEQVVRDFLASIP